MHRKTQMFLLSSLLVLALQLAELSPTAFAASKLHRSAFDPSISCDSIASQINDENYRISVLNTIIKQNIDDEFKGQGAGGVFSSQDALMIAIKRLSDLEFEYNNLGCGGHN